jgi:hypothetical protein
MTAINANSGMRPMEQAQGRQRLSPEERFAKMDSDASGGVSFEEFQAMGEKVHGKSGQQPPAGKVEEFFSALDTNEDGVLSLEELESGKPPKPQSMNATSGVGMQGMGQQSDMNKTLLDYLSQQSDEDASEPAAFFNNPNILAEQMTEAYELFSTKLTI